MTLLFFVLALSSLSSLVVTLATDLSVRSVSRRREPRGPTPGISVLKPLKGLDHGLYENLASLAAQDYPDFELLLAAEDPHDPALDIARQLQREFPGVRVKIIFGLHGSGLNPKVNSLIVLERHAMYDHVLISDSNVRVGRDYLRAMAAELRDPRVGLVSSVLSASGERNLGASLDNLHMNSFVVRAVCGADVLASHPCVVGKSMLFRRSVLQTFGGFARVCNVLAEDYVLGKLFNQAGFRVALSPYIVPTVNAERSLREFWARHVRWGQMRRQIAPLLYLAEPLFSPVPFIALGLLGLALGADPSFVSRSALGQFFAACLLLKLASDAHVVGRVRGARLRASEVPRLLLKDLMVLGIWASGALKRTVVWRGNVLKIGPGSQLIRVA